MFAVAIFVLWSLILIFSYELDQRTQTFSIEFWTTSFIKFFIAMLLYFGCFSDEVSGVIVASIGIGIGIGFYLLVAMLRSIQYGMGQTKVEV